ncbi:MAG: hypothetical protein HOQ17_01160 [Gemmatimonadaceae bacterium]|nr:hypothetical protein [Gemmatimonadaceae bacterium]NUO95346.1 hypothetical protein [Gemmatimonadaceae bacterium]NUP55666.1 hypothetical protein [Gemmatimonadaceae bacterium]NUS31637.1 hypothetical protein [Gemmatimonadaceae bacterium]NUS49238.1 hypothetical protein [Gemmatimonadaceae bacterium]
MRDPESDADAAARRATRMTELLAELAQVNRPLAPTMSEAEFRAMIQRLAEQQLLYEEFGDER